MKRTLRNLALVAGLLAVVLGPVSDPPASADGGTPSVAMTPNVGLTDGQQVTITVKTAPDVPVYRAETRLCRGGIAYQPSDGNRPAADFEGDGPNCPGPSHPISSSADSLVTDSSTYTNAPTADGESFLFRIGSGVVSWTNSADGSPANLTCDATHACVLVVELLHSPGANQPAQWKPVVLPINYGDNDPISSCGGPAADVLNTGGSDRMTDAWIRWTVAACKLEGAKGAPGRASFVGEGNAVTGFSVGAYDLAYTATGYASDAALAPVIDAALPNGGRRDGVLVPVGLNAAVIAVGGGRAVDATHKVPYKTIQMKASEAAAMISGGTHGIAQPSPNSTSDSPKSYGDDLKARNAELAQTDLFDSNAGFAVGAYADAEASSFFATRFFKMRAAQQWKVPDLPIFANDRGKTRTVDSSLATANPSYSQALTLLSGRPALRKGLIGPGANTQGGVWVLTDLVTAKALGLTPVQIENAAGEFVAPTAESLRAAAASMTADESGALIGDPNVTAKQAGVTPYPLTFVEYAMAPAEPLVDQEDCSARTGSQKLLKNWLTFITGDGQATLPEGLVGLTEALRADAAKQIPKVGATDVTGACATLASGGDGVPLAPPAASTSSDDAPRVADSVVDRPLSPRSRTTTSRTPQVANFTAAPASSSEKPHAHIPLIPDFVGAHSVGWFASFAAVVGIVALAAAALFKTSRAVE